MTIETTKFNLIYNHESRWIEVLQRNKLFQIRNRNDNSWNEKHVTFLWWKQDDDNEICLNMWTKRCKNRERRECDETIKMTNVNEEVSEKINECDMIEM